MQNTVIYKIVNDVRIYYIQFENHTRNHTYLHNSNTICQMQITLLTKSEHNAAGMQLLK